MYLIEWTIPAFIVLGIFIASVRILKEYERGVIFFLGRFQKVKGPGLIIVIPLIQKMERVDLRVITYDIPTQDVISKDNVTVHVSAVLYFRVVDPERAVIQVEQFFVATSELAQTTLRSVLGQHDLDEMLSQREKLNADIQRWIIVDTGGVDVENLFPKFRAFPGGGHGFLQAVQVEFGAGYFLKSGDQILHLLETAQGT